MKTHNILYLSYDGMTDPLGESQVLPYLRGLSREGYRFSLISFEKSEKLKINKAHIQKICDESAIDWYPLVYTKRPPILSTIFDVLRLYTKAYNLHKQKFFSLVHCRSYLPSLVGLSMKKKLGIKFLFDMRGFWADERVDGNLWNLKNPAYKAVYRYFKDKEKDFLEYADHTISLTYNGAKEIHSWQHIRNNPVALSVIPCCVDLNHFDPLSIKLEEKEKKRKDLGIGKDDFVLSYIGSIGTWYLLEDMLRFFKIVQEEKPNSKFFFITGDDPISIHKSAKTLNISLSSIIIKQATRQLVPLYLSLSNYSIFFIKPSYSKKSSSPTKQGEIMGMGIPIICNSGVGDTDSIVKKYKSGIVVEELNETYYKHVISLILNTLKFSNECLLKGADNYFSLKKGIIKYKNIYNDCLNC